MRKLPDREVLQYNTCDSLLADAEPPLDKRALDQPPRDLISRGRTGEDLTGEEQESAEPLQQWLLGASPEALVGEATEWLAQARSMQPLWRTCASTALTYLNNRLRDEQGNPSQALIGAHTAYTLAIGQPEQIRQQLLLQSLQQTVEDLHDPAFSPYELLPFGPHHGQTSEETAARLYRSLQMGNASSADHSFVALVHQWHRRGVLNLLIEISLRALPGDTHPLLLLSTALETPLWHTWPQQQNQLRWVIRYSSGIEQPSPVYLRAKEPLQRHQMENGAPYNLLQPEFIDPMRATLHAAASDGPELVVQAMRGDHISPQTILAAAARLVCEYVVQGDFANPTYSTLSGRPLQRGGPSQMASSQPEEITEFLLNTSLLLSTLHRMLPYMSPEHGAIAAVLAGERIQALAAQYPPPGSQDPQPAATHRCRPYQHMGHSTQSLLCSLQKTLQEQNGLLSMALIDAYARASGPSGPLVTLLIEAASTASQVPVLMHLHAMLWEFHAWRVEHEKGSGKDISPTIMPDSQKTEPTAGWGFLVQAAYFIAVCAE